MTAVTVHLVDGTFELFRTWFGAPSSIHRGREIGASRALLRSLAAWLRGGDVTHVGVAFDHVIESFRNQLFAGYKTGDGIEPALLAQFPLAEQVAAAAGLVVWPMLDLEADDGLASAAHVLSGDPDVARVVIASPDKDLTQCVRGDRVVTWDRIRDRTLDEAGVIAKFGVAPTSIPDYLALVGDTADGIPGLPRWGARSAATVLARWRTIEAIPDDEAAWDVTVRGRAALAAVLRERRDDALLYRTLATLRTDAATDAARSDRIDARLDTLAWRGADGPALDAVCEIVDLDPASLGLPRRT
ncbi:MAG: flap endonuclease [Kofleriaceae bacterium]|nr:flap endonuclease [Kofleriaceae bacterium]